MYSDDEDFLLAIKVIRFFPDYHIEEELIDGSSMEMALGILRHLGLGTGCLRFYYFCCNSRQLTVYCKHNERSVWFGNCRRNQKHAYYGLN